MNQNQDLLADVVHEFLEHAGGYTSSWKHVDSRRSKRHEYIAGNFNDFDDWTRVIYLGQIDKHVNLSYHGNIMTKKMGAPDKS